MGLPLSSALFLRRSRPARPSNSSTVRAVHERGGLKIVELRGDDVGVTLRVSGEMDFGYADLLSPAVVHAIASDEPVVHLDLSRLTFCDCAGLRAIVGVQTYLQQRGGRLTLLGVQPIVRRLIEVAGFEDQLLRDELA